MSKPQTQAPSGEGKIPAPIYTKEELEEKIDILNGRVGEIMEWYREAYKILNDMYRALYEELGTNTSTVRIVDDAIFNLDYAVKNAIDKIIINVLELDTDIEKYEKQYNVEFPYETERLLGIVMLKEGEAVKPVVIWTDYRDVGYVEGEKRE